MSSELLSARICKEAIMPFFKFVIFIKRFSLCSLWIHITGLLIVLSGYLIFGPIPQLNFIASLPLTITGLALQGIGFSICYIGETFP